MKKVLFGHWGCGATFLFLLLAISLAYAATDFNIFYIDGNADNGGLPSFSFARDGNLTIDINASDNNYGTLLLDLNYYLTTYTYNTPIIDDLNLNSYLGCLDNNLNDSTRCSVYFDIRAVADGNYFIEGVVRDTTGGAGSYRFDTSDNNFMIDNTAPTTTDDANAGWQNFDANVRLTCNDGNGSGCATIQYREDTDSSAAVSYGAWQIYNLSQIPFIADGNWAFDYYSIDVAGNTETVKSAYVLVDKIAPDINIIQPAGASTSSNLLWFEVSQGYGSNINANTIKAEINGAPSDLNFPQHCVETGEGYKCSWAESSLASGNDYNLAVFAKDSVEWRATAQRVFTYAIPAPGSLPDININYIDGYADSNALPAFSYARDGLITIDFNVADLTPASLLLDMNYSSQNVQGTGMSIAIGAGITAADDLNLNSYAGCDDSNFLDSTHCSINWNAMGIADGNYYILASLTSNPDTAIESSDNNFLIDNTKPVIAFTLPASGEMTTNTFTVKFDINDSGGSGVDGGNVFFDTNATDINTAIVIGSSSWDMNYIGTYTVSNVPDGDYNVAIRAVDKAGNQADQNTALIHYDTNAPSVSIESVSTSSDSATITYSGFDSGSGIKEYWIRLDYEGSLSGSWENNGTATSKTYSSLSAGSYTFYLRATDYANSNSPDANTNFTISASNGGNPGGGPGGGPSPPTPALQCTDTDNGDDLFTFGYAYAKRGNSPMTLLQLDKCSDKGNPNEMEYDIIEAICIHEQPKGAPRNCPENYHCGTSPQTINDTAYLLAACVPDENTEEAGEEDLFESFSEQVAEKLAELKENLSEKLIAFMEGNPIISGLVSLVLEKRAIASEREKAIRNFNVSDAKIVEGVEEIASEEINLEQFESELKLFSGHFKKHLYLALKDGSEEERKLLYKQVKNYLREVEKGA